MIYVKCLLFSSSAVAFYLLPMYNNYLLFLLVGEAQVFLYQTTTCDSELAVSRRIAELFY